MATDQERLIAAYLAGNREPDFLAELLEALAEDAELRAGLRDELALARMLRELGRPALDPAPVFAAIQAPGGGLSDQVMARIGRAESASARRWRWRGLAAAALVAGVALAIAASAALGWPPSAAPAPAIASLHLVRGTRWPAQLAAPPAEGARLAPGRFELAAGVAELAFDSQASLLVEGPATLELESAMLVRLHRGRVTTSVPPGAHGFTIAARGMRVVDLGTEAGVDVGSDGRAEVQVYAGAVEVAVQGGSAPTASRRCQAGAALRVDPGAGSIDAMPFAPERFIRAGDAHRLRLDVADIVGGGDGRGSAAHDGIDPTTGRLQSTPAQGHLEGDHDFHPVAGQPFLDGVFVPSPKRDTILTSAGHHYDFALQNGASYDLIRRGGFLIRPPDGGPDAPSRSPSVIDGVDYAAPGHALVGFHANTGMTFDLRAIGGAYGRAVTRFTAAVANTAPRRLAPALCAVQRAGSPGPRWAPLAVQRAGTANGTVLTLEPDGSLLAHDPAATDTYTVAGISTVPGITALRLEVLADPALPGSGPGAAANGNFVLTRLGVGLESGDGERQLGLTGAVADFSQAGWPVAAAVTGEAKVGWGIVPETGTAHTAVFFLEPAAVPPGTGIVVTLAQLQREWHHHLIGRFRLSVTDDPDPARGIAGGAGFFQVFVDGRLIQRAVVPVADQAPARIEVPLRPEDRFLTLVSTDGGYGNGFQWTTLADPRLELR
jgi:hypothetical protein